MAVSRQRRKPGTRDAALARDAILDAAVREFAARGLSGARMDALARDAGVAKGLVFHHFGSKEGLWKAALERIYALLRAGQDADALGALDPAEGMRRLARATFRLFRAHPEIVALMNEENLHRARHVRATPRIRALYNPLFATIEDLLARGRAAGVFRADVDATALYIALAGLGYFYCSNRWTLSSAFAGDMFAPRRVAAYEALVGEMVVAYLAAPATPAARARARRSALPARRRRE